MAGTFTGLFLITLTTLLLELSLIRILDVLWYPNLAYMIIMMAMLAFGLSGVYTSVRKAPEPEKAPTQLYWLCILFCLFTLALYPALNLITFNFADIETQPVREIGSFVAIYVFLALPFFVSGVVLTTLFTIHNKAIQKLYFWDLVGAALGSVILIPLLPKIGGAGLLFFAGGLGAIAAGFFVPHKIKRLAALGLGICCIAAPFLKSGYFDFAFHFDKRNITSVKHKIEHTVWDPISKIDVVDYLPRIKWIAYDGGTQTSYFYQFDGDLKALRESLPQDVEDHFWGRIVLVSHYLKRDTDQEVLVIGSAGGQETKAALAYGAAHVDGIELVGSVVEFGKNQYAEYTGNIFNHPKANIQTGEGRTFLRSSTKQYDIIQMMSNHTSSSIAAGTGAMATNYLQTADAYREYFEHLKDDGILHINHHIYPRMVSTAALAWKQMGRDNFRDHVLVFEVQDAQDNLPTLLIKMSPWTEQEVAEANRFMKNKMVVKPEAFGQSFISEDFFTGEFPDELADRMEYRADPVTDDRPYFNHIRKKMEPVLPDLDNYMGKSISRLLNSRIQAGVPRDVIHFFVSGTVALVLSVVFLLVPLLFSEVGRSTWKRKGSFITYFSCLGAGFIIFELVFIQLFMKLIGYPLYTYSTVVFIFLFGAGLGSYFSHHQGWSSTRGWNIPFIGVIAYMAIFLVTHQWLFDYFLMLDTWQRITVACIMIFPLAFFLGMPFPLGILAVGNRGGGVVAWAWAFNGLFTVIGGLASVLISMFAGFKLTLVLATAIYLLGMFMFQRMREPAKRPIAQELRAMS